MLYWITWNFLDKIINILVRVSSNGLNELNTWDGEGGGVKVIQSEGKYELEWLKQFNADKDERFI